MTLQCIISYSQSQNPGVHILDLACGHKMLYGGSVEKIGQQIECTYCKNDLLRKGLPTAPVKRKRRAYLRPDFVKHGARAKEMLPVGIL